MPVNADTVSTIPVAEPVGAATLRLAGTAALSGFPADHPGVLLLRQACAAQGDLIFEAMRLQARLRSEGRCDPLREITGMASLERGVAELTELIKALDERLSAESIRR